MDDPADATAAAFLTRDNNVAIPKTESTIGIRQTLRAKIDDFAQHP